MDDFGTGYSSFNYLCAFRLRQDQDRPAVRAQHDARPGDAGDRQDHRHTWKSLGVTVTAEGVETEEQAAMLREFGCPEAQGFLYGQPGAPDATGTAKVTPIKSRDERRLIIGGLRDAARLR